MFRNGKKFKTLCIEHELFLSLLSRNLDDGGVAKLRALCAQNPDWEYVYQIASWHCVANLTCKAIGRHCPDLVPAKYVERFKRDYQYNVMHNMSLMQELRSLLQLFMKNGIGPIIYKGPLQAAEIYGSLGLRHLCDLDFIVRKEDLQKTFDLLLRSEYSCPKQLTSAQICKLTEDKSAYECSFLKKNSETFIEIHWQVLRCHSEMGVDADYIWRHTVPVTVGGMEALNFNNEIKFYLMCLHNEKHGWSDLKFLCDVAWLLGSPMPVDFEYVMEEARRTGKEKTVLKTILLANRMLGAPIPRPITSRIDSDKRLKMEAALSHFQIFKNEFYFPSYAEWLDILGRYTQPGLADGYCRPIHTNILNYIQTLLTPQYEDHKKFPKPLPKQLQALYVASRVLRIIKNRREMSRDKEKA